MGYKRTVRCSHCYGEGHNKMGCPQLKEQIERYRADYGDDHWRVRDYDAKKKRMADAKNNRKCSYCGQPGHSRAGCEILKNVKEQFRTKNVQYRENFLKALIDNGIGVGALVKAQAWRGESVFMITSINWSQINMAQKSQDVIQYLDVSEMRHINNENWHTKTRLPSTITGNGWSPDWEVVVPTSSSAILADCPKDFIGGKKVKGKLIAGKLGIKEVFKNKDLGIYSMKDYYGDFDNEFNIDSFTTEIGQ